ncbi:hypothetical protein [Nocardioides dilutus]
MRSWPTVLAAAALSISLAGSLGACGDDGEDPSAEDTATASSSPTPSETASPSASESAVATETPSETPSPTEEAGTVVVISIEGDQIKPGGDRIEVERGEVVTLKITSDRAGELHVHSKPEQYVEFEEGTSNHKLAIDAPGIVDVEDHETGFVIVQLAVQ